MTDKLDLAKLKAVAEAARDDNSVGGLERVKLMQAMSPPTVLRLIERVERLDGALRLLLTNSSLSVHQIEIIKAALEGE